MKPKSLSKLLEQIQIYLLEETDESKKLETELDELLDETEMKKAAKAAKQSKPTPRGRNVQKFSGMKASA